MTGRVMRQSANEASAPLPEGANVNGLVQIVEKTWKAESTDGSMDPGKQDGEGSK